MLIYKRVYHCVFRPSPLKRRGGPQWLAPQKHPEKKQVKVIPEDKRTHLYRDETWRFDMLTPYEYVKSACYNMGCHVIRFPRSWCFPNYFHHITWVCPKSPKTHGASSWFHIPIMNLAMSEGIEPAFRCTQNRMAWLSLYPQYILITSASVFTKFENQF